MTGFDRGRTLAERMRRHAGDRTHLYAHLMRGMADDWEAGGPVREICRGWENAPHGSVVQLRLLAGVFRLVLTDRAPELVPYYPCLGGTAAPEGAWAVVRPVLARHVDELRTAVEIAPQTNEAGRSVALLVGLFEAVRRTGVHQVRLLEPGASAGLNLLVDRFRYEGSDWASGPVDSPLVLADAVVGAVVPQECSIVSRRGCDLSPVDPSRPEGQLRLRSFVWPFQVDRHERLTAALQIAERHPVAVDRAGAGEWLETQLAEPVDDDVLTVVWQSVTRLYWPPAETARVERAVSQASLQGPLAHIAMEYPDGGEAGGSGSPERAELTLDLRERGGTEASRWRLGTVGDHGIPVWLD